MNEPHKAKWAWTSTGAPKSMPRGGPTPRFRKACRIRIPPEKRRGRQPSCDVHRERPCRLVIVKPAVVPLPHRPAAWVIPKGLVGGLLVARLGPVGITLRKAKPEVAVPVRQPPAQPRGRAVALRVPAERREEATASLTEKSQCDMVGENGLGE